MQILHNISRERLEVVQSIEGVLEKSVLPILKDTAKIWQPADFLPDPASPDFLDEVGVAAPVHLNLSCLLHCLGPDLLETGGLSCQSTTLRSPMTFVFMQVAELRKRTDCLPDSYFVVLVGDMITEEALPTYMAMLNTLDGVRDETGAAPTPWGRYATCQSER